MMIFGCFSLLKWLRVLRCVCKCVRVCVSDFTMQTISKLICIFSFINVCTWMCFDDPLLKHVSMRFRAGFNAMNIEHTTNCVNLLYLICIRSSKWKQIDNFLNTHQSQQNISIVIDPYSEMFHFVQTSSNAPISYDWLHYYLSNTLWNQFKVKIHADVCISIDRIEWTVSHLVHFEFCMR